MTFSKLEYNDNTMIPGDPRQCKSSQDRDSEETEPIKQNT